MSSQQQRPPAPPSEFREPILATKITLPSRRPGLVARPRLTERMSPWGGAKVGPSQSLTLVVAPAGFGKTTLISEWCAGLAGVGEPRVAFLSLDPGDNDPARFLTYCVAALRTVVPGVGEGALALLRSPQPAPQGAVVTVLLNDLAAVAEPLTLVLDDYHLIAEPQVHEAVALLLERLPPSLHLMIVSRADPPLPLSRLRGRGLLTELRAADLRCAGEEAGAFLNDRMGLGLPDESVAALEARTEGWIAGLQLAALSLQGRGDGAARDEFIRAFTGSHRYVVDYLGEEVLRQQPAEVQEFLLRTSVLNRLCGPLCDAVTRAAPGTGARILEDLDRANLFLVPLDEEREWWRYHHLFADMLRALRLRREAAGEGAELERRASEWFASQGLWAEAVEHAQRGGLHELAARILADHAGDSAWRRGELQTLSRWLDALPDAVRRAHPKLSLLRARPLLVSVRLDEIAALLDDAQQALGGTPPEGEDALWAELLATRAFVARFRDDVDGALVLCDEAARRFPRDSDNLWAAGLELIRGNIRSARGDLSSAAGMFLEAARLSERLGEVQTLVIALTSYAAVCEEQGRLSEAARAYERLLRFVEAAPLRGEAATRSNGTLVPAACYGTIGLAGVAYARGDDAGARRLLHGAREQAQLIGAIQPLFRATDIEVEWALRAGDVPLARERLEEWEEAIRQAPLPTLHAVTRTLRTRIALATGDLEAADAWARGLGEGAADCLEREVVPGTAEAEEYLGREWELLMLARVHAARGRHGDALALLTGIRRRAEAMGRGYIALKCRVLEAVAHAGQGDSGAARAALVEALRLGEPEGYVRVFAEHGALLAPLLRQVAAAPVSGVLASYVGALLAAGSVTVVAAPAPEPPRAPAAPAALAPPVEPLAEADHLSEREVEVLRLVAAGLSNPEIAERLFLSVGTVKRHVHNIYGKLGTGNRVEAITRGRELGLL